MKFLNIQDTYYLLTAISAIVILTLSFLLTSVHLPQNTEYRKFNLTQRYLAVSYLILGSAGLFSFFMPKESTDSASLLLITAAVASFQSLLFTAAHIVFLQPDDVHGKQVVLHFSGIVIVGIGLTLLYLYDVASPIFYSTLFIAYLSQQIYYTSKFQKTYKKCLRQMEQFYDEEQSARLRALYVSFYCALSIGLLSLTAAVSGLLVYVIFIILYTLFYTYMVSLVFNNRLITQIILPAVSHKEVQEECPSPPLAVNEDVSVPHLHTEEYRVDFKQRLDSWINQKGYLQKDLSVEEIASLLNTDREYLRYYFRTYIHSDFRTWRSVLRINEAKEIMKAHPEYSFSKIADMVGFNHRANFFNQFLKIEGMTPTEWTQIKENENLNETPSDN